MCIKIFLCSVFLLGALSPSVYGAPAIDVGADLKLRQMGEYLKSAHEFTFRADIIYDTVMKDGQKILFSSVSQVGCTSP